MRILLVADVHSNRPALEAVREPFDVALFLGDLVDYGVEPAPCVAWVREHCPYRVRGNHDHGAAHNVTVVPPNRHSFKYLTAPTRALNRQRMSEDDRRFLASLPLTRFLTLDGLRYLLVHATPRDPLDEFAPPDPELWARRLEGLDVDVVCVGHTHQPYALTVGDTLVVNPGSVGVQREGDPRAAYGVIEGRTVNLRRVEYDVEAAVRAVEESPLADDVKYLLAHVYREGRLPPPGANGAAKPQPAGATLALRGE
jgi:putative phosphoesterase